MQPFSNYSDLAEMADFPVNPEWVWLLTIVPLMGGVFLSIAAIAGLTALIMGSTRAPRARYVGFRAAALALGSAAFPLIPLAFLKWGAEFDYDWVVVLFWLSILFFVFGCWWLTRPSAIPSFLTWKPDIGTLDRRTVTHQQLPRMRKPRETWSRQA